MPDALTKREAIYDEEIAPLMGKIIAICKEHEIPMVADFQLNDDRERCSELNEDGDEVGPFHCTTLLTHFDDTAEKLCDAARILRPAPAPEWGGFIVHPDGRREQVTGSNMPDESP